MNNDNMVGKDIQELFWKKVIKNDNPNACYIWIGTRQKSGHGRLGIGQTEVLAHRYSYQYYIGDIPENLVIRHMCKNAPCVNPLHLIPGTRAQNNADNTRPIPEWIVVIDPASVTPKLTKEEKLLIRFWEKVDVQGEDEHWLWDSVCNPDGYGHFKIGNKMISAHRLSYEFTYGKIEDDSHVLHSCDIRNCVNPKHLFLGDHLLNMQDKAKKGRVVSHYVKGHRKTPRKYSNEDIKMVFRLDKEGMLRYKIAELLGTDPSYISEILNGKARTDYNE